MCSRDRGRTYELQMRGAGHEGSFKLTVGVNCCQRVVVHFALCHLASCVEAAVAQLAAETSGRLRARGRGKPPTRRSVLEAVRSGWSGFIEHNYNNYERIMSAVEYFERGGHKAADPWQTAREVWKHLLRMHDPSKGSWPPLDLPEDPEDSEGSAADGAAAVAGGDVDGSDRARARGGEGGQRRATTGQAGGAAACRPAKATREGAAGAGPASRSDSVRHEGSGQRKHRLSPAARRLGPGSERRLCGPVAPASGATPQVAAGTGAAFASGSGMAPAAASRPSTPATAYVPASGLPQPGRAVSRGTGCPAATAFLQAPAGQPPPGPVQQPQLQGWQQQSRTPPNPPRLSSPLPPRGYQPQSLPAPAQQQQQQRGERPATPVPDWQHPGRSLPVQAPPQQQRGRQAMSAMAGSTSGQQEELRPTPAPFPRFQPQGAPLQAMHPLQQRQQQGHGNTTPDVCDRYQPQDRLGQAPPPPQQQRLGQGRTSPVAYHGNPAQGLPVQAAPLQPPQVPSAGLQPPERPVQASAVAATEPLQPPQQAGPAPHYGHQRQGWPAQAQGQGRYPAVVTSQLRGWTQQGQQQQPSYGSAQAAPSAHAGLAGRAWQPGPSTANNGWVQQPQQAPAQAANQGHHPAAQFRQGQASGLPQGPPPLPPSFPPPPDQQHGLCADDDDDYADIDVDAIIANHGY